MTKQLMIKRVVVSALLAAAILMVLNSCAAIKRTINPYGSECTAKKGMVGY